MNKFSKTYKYLIRKSVHCEPNLEDLQSKTYMSDIVCESVFPKLWRLIADIKQHFEKQDSKTVYKKADLIRLIDKDWKYYDEFLALPETMTLTILICRRDEINTYAGFDAGEVIGLMSELNDIENPENWIHEFIWIDKTKKFDDALFEDLLQYELGHVWTFLFGNNDNNFTAGQTVKLDKSLDIFNKFQLDVLTAFYGKNKDILEKDIKYILGNNQEPFSYEFTAIVDEIIEVLVEDYLEENQTISVNAYLILLFDTINNWTVPRFDKLSIIKHYIEQNHTSESLM